MGLCNTTLVSFDELQGAVADALILRRVLVGGQVAVGVESGRHRSAGIRVQKHEGAKASLVPRMPNKRRPPVANGKERQADRIFIDFGAILDRRIQRLPHFGQRRMS